MNPSALLLIIVSEVHTLHFWVRYDIYFSASTPFHQVPNKHFSVFATERQDDLSLLDTNPTAILYYREGLNNVFGLGLDLETM